MDLATRHFHSLFVWEGKRKCLGPNQARARFPAHEETLNSIPRNPEKHTEKPRTALNDVHSTTSQLSFRTSHLPKAEPRLFWCSALHRPTECAASVIAARCTGHRTAPRFPFLHTAIRKGARTSIPKSVLHTLIICPEKTHAEHSPTKPSAVKGHPYCFSMKNSPGRTTTWNTIPNIRFRPRTIKQDASEAPRDGQKRQKKSAERVFSRKFAEKLSRMLARSE